MFPSTSSKYTISSGQQTFKTKQQWEIPQTKTSETSYLGSKVHNSQIVSPLKHYRLYLGIDSQKIMHTPIPSDTNIEPYLEWAWRTGLHPSGNTMNDWYENMQWHQLAKKKLLW